MPKSQVKARRRGPAPKRHAKPPAPSKPKAEKKKAAPKPTAPRKVRGSDVADANWRQLLAQIQPEKLVAAETKTEPVVEAKTEVLVVDEEATVPAKKRERRDITEKAERRKAPFLIPLRKPLPEGALKKPVSMQKKKTRTEGEEGDDMPTHLEAIESENNELTGVLALDCEMVGVGPGGRDSMLASVCIVNDSGNTVYFSYVAPGEKVVDYRTEYSGIRPANLVGAPSFAVVQRQVADLIKGRIVTGHGLENDFAALRLRHPSHLIRDTAKFTHLQRMPGKPRKLSWLAKEILGVKIQSEEHSPEQDARASVLIYKKLQKDWEARIEAKKRAKREAKKNGKEERGKHKRGQTNKKPRRK